jgi:hypothetical protein
VGPGTPVREEELKQPAKLLQGPLASKTIEVIRAVTHLADDQITRVVVAMVVDEATSQTEATIDVFLCAPRPVLPDLR